MSSMVLVTKVTGGVLVLLGTLMNVVELPAVGIRSFLAARRRRSGAA